jgi:type IX secretion system PorP/SprF family membrane protein
VIRSTRCMLRIKKLILGLAILGSNCLVAQQTEIYNQFFMNPYLYNAAYAGVEGHTVLYALYHKKWTNITGSPQVSHVSFHTPLKGGIGIGAAAFNDTYGAISRSQGKISASYLLTVDREHHFRFGLSAGMGTQGLNFGELDDPTDPAFLNIASNSSFVVADFGATYHFDHFNVGFSIPNLIGYDLFHGESFSPVRVKPLDDLMFKANYRGHISHDLAIEPHLIYRYSSFIPDQIEATVIFHIYHVVWAGATFRQNNTYAATVGAKIKEKFAVGYGFELGNASISGLTGPSHEVHIGMHLGTKKEHAAHVSSFIKSHRLTPEQRAALAAKEREEKLQALQASRQTEVENTDELSIAGTSQQNTDKLGITGTGQQGSDELEIAGNTDEENTLPEEESWEVDESLPSAVRTNPFGEQERAIVIKQVNSNGETVYAVAWEPIDEDWELVDEAPIKRESSDGATELGVKYYRTNEQGEKELIIKWEPVVTESQMNNLLESTSTEEVLAQQLDENNLSLSENEIVTDYMEQEPQQIDRGISSEISDAQTDDNEIDAEETGASDQIAVNQDKDLDTQVNETPIETIQDITDQEGNTEGTSPNEVEEPMVTEASTEQPRSEIDSPAEETVPEERQNNNDQQDQIVNDEPESNDERVRQEETTDPSEPIAVKRGNHILELPAGYFLIGGSFNEFEHAENYSDELFPKGYHDVFVGFSTERGHYYTVISRHSSLDEANRAKDRIRQRSGMSDVWVLQVNN